MSSAYEGKDPLELAKQAEKDLNSREAKTGHGTSDTSTSRDHPVLTAPVADLR